MHKSLMTNGDVAKVLIAFPGTGSWFLEPPSSVDSELEDSRGNEKDKARVKTQITHFVSRDQLLL